MHLQLGENEAEHFKVGTAYLRQLVTYFSVELQRGLAEDGSMLPLLPTYIAHMPSGKEQGEVAVIDLGGTNVRVGVVRLLGGHRYESELEGWTIPQDLKQGSGHALFAYISSKMRAFLEKKRVGTHMVGFTFSFPVKQTSWNNGVLLQWNKDLELDNVLGLDVVQLLQEALTEQGLDLRVSGLVNDTVGTLVGAKYADPRAQMSVILGTGTNAAYVERTERIRKLRVRGHGGGHTILNVEWGAFGDGPNVHTYLPVNAFDEAVDAGTHNPGRQRFEKMTSGMYLPLLYKAACGEQVTTEQMSLLERSEGSALCRAISTRSARLIAAAIVALAKHVCAGGGDGAVVVAVDGSLFEHYHGYRERIEQTIRELTDLEVQLVLFKDMSAIGAAAAVLAHLSEDQGNASE